MAKKAAAPEYSMMTEVRELPGMLLGKKVLFIILFTTGAIWALNSDWGTTAETQSPTPVMAPSYEFHGGVLTLPAGSIPEGYEVRSAAFNPAGTPVVVIAPLADTPAVAPAPAIGQ